MWFGLAGPPVAFTVFLIAGVALSEARCDTHGFDLDAAVAVLTAVCAGVSGLGVVAAVTAWRRSRDAGEEPPASRVHFMATMAMTVAPLILVIVLMAGIGVLVLPACVQAADGPPIVRPPGEAARSDRELGAQLFAANCASCHGSRGGGVAAGRPQSGASSIRGVGPSLHRAGAQAADFYLTTGSMPIRRPRDQPIRSRPAFHPREIRALTAYVASLGSGPAIPNPPPGDVASGRSAFTEHCAGCHQVVGAGGIVTGAKVPSLDVATPTQIAEAVRVGPYVMPRFSRQTISDAELADIVAYVRYAQHPRDPGGWSIDHLGPFPEGLVAWFVALGTLLATCIAIGSRVRR